MAITTDKKVGRTRIKLAELLAAELEKIDITAPFPPQDLISQNPYYASAQMDCCSWYGYGKTEDGFQIYVYSWNTMGECLKGLTLESDGMFLHYEVHADQAKRPKKFFPRRLEEAQW